MIILGIDPGYAIVGYGAIRFERGRFCPVGYGAVTTEAEEPFHRRLEVIYDNMEKMLSLCKPDAMAVEKLYFQNNQKTGRDIRPSPFCQKSHCSAILVLSLLVGNRAGSFAGRLTRGLTLTAAALTSALLERSAGQRFNMFHNLTSLSDILCIL